MSKQDELLTELARLIWYIRTGSIYPKDEWDRAKPVSKKVYYAQAEMFLAKARPILKQEGAREVIEWVADNSWKTELVNIWDGSDIPIFAMKIEDWQALKERYAKIKGEK